MGQDISNVTPLFKAPLHGPITPKGVDPRPKKRTKLKVINPENTSLNAAQRCRFDQMCADLLWGTEQEDKERFGELLRSVVIEFLPTTMVHFHLLRAVVEQMQLLARSSGIQKNVFEAGTDRTGRHRLPIGTWNAYEWSGKSSQILHDLQKAIKIYYSVRNQ